jgi:hypothetical protein
VQRWDYLNRVAYFWVKIPTVLAIADTQIYLYFDYKGGGTPPFHQPNAYMNSNYVRAYHLDEDNSEGAWDDGAAGEHDISYIVGTTAGTGKINKCRYHDGADDFYDIPHDTDLNITDDITFSFWFKPTYLPGGILAKYLFCGMEPATWIGKGYGFYRQAGSLAFGLRGDGWNAELDGYGDPGPILSVGNWYHIIMRRRRSDGYMDIRVNRQEYKEGYLYPGGAIATNTTPYRVGTRSDNSAEDAYGYIDDFRISNVFRSNDWCDLENICVEKQDDWGTVPTNYLQAEIVTAPQKVIVPRPVIFLSGGEVVWR